MVIYFPFLNVTLRPHTRRVVTKEVGRQISKDAMSLLMPNVPSSSMILRVHCVNGHCCCTRSIACGRGNLPPIYFISLEIDYSIFVREI